MWGWHTLSPLAPFADAAPYEGDPQKIIVLMTDGDNLLYSNGLLARSVYSGTGYLINGQHRLGITSGTPAARTTQMDRRLEALCANVKAKKIVIYAVRLEVGSSNDTLRKCASGAEFYHEVTTASQLTTVFEGIANSIVNPRLIR
jgi:hypothetical protein